MSGFSFNDPAPVSAEPPIANDGFFPAIDPAALRRQQRLRETVTADRLHDAIVAAMLWAATDLIAWKAGHVAAGHATLASVPSDQLAGMSRLVLLYQRAIACYARAELTERYRDVDITGQGQRSAESLDPSIDELRRDARYALRDMLGRGRLAIELI